MLESLVTFAVVIVVLGVLVGVLAYLYAKSNYTTGKSETESIVLKEAARQRAEAEAEHQKVLEENRAKYL